MPFCSGLEESPRLLEIRQKIDFKKYDLEVNFLLFSSGLEESPRLLENKAKN